MRPKTRILLGVTGGIAAYKSPDLVRRLIERGAEVQVVMTRSARNFITPMSLQAVSGRPVRGDLWDSAAEAAMGHIELARWAEVVLIAPASADFIARLAGGRADDLLAALCLATEAPLVLAPAMNRLMWANKATQANIETLKSRGMRLLGPGIGDQACGEIGVGRMWEPKQLAETLLEPPVNAGLLAGLDVLITAGPTRERLDPVRYLTNRSSGKMGFAVATAAREAGAHVTLVTGPVQLPTPAGITRIDVESARDMYSAVHRHVAEADVFIAAAAVADFQPVSVAKQKIKKQGGTVKIDLEAAPDIIKSVADMVKRPFVVGFAAETNDVEENARSKLKRKKLDLIAANQVGDGIAFDCEDNALTVLWPGGKVEIARAPKLDVARELIALIAKRLPPTDGAPRRGTRKRRTQAAIRAAAADPRTRLRSRRIRR
ncbi:MAG: bifunctional phosphopantothenoylcysteine decarboxylase/phosphopantothenate--cysteine ligase CoaBC [Steroidobacteraceae bacterium]